MGVIVPKIGLVKYQVIDVLTILKAICIVMIFKRTRYFKDKMMLYEGATPVPRWSFKPPNVAHFAMYHVMPQGYIASRSYGRIAELSALCQASLHDSTFPHDDSGVPLSPG